MRIKPTHLRACAAVLEGDFATAEDAAKAVIETIDRLRSEDVTYMAVRQYTHPVSGSAYMGYGPFPTANAATKAAEKGQVGLPGTGVLAVVPVRSYESTLAKLRSLDELPTHLAGGFRIREVPK